jgi:hypothetical protein
MFSSVSGWAVCPSMPVVSLLLVFLTSLVLLFCYIVTFAIPRPLFSLLQVKFVPSLSPLFFILVSLTLTPFLFM